MEHDYGISSTQVSHMGRPCWAREDPNPCNTKRGFFGMPYAHGTYHWPSWLCVLGPVDLSLTQPTWVGVGRPAPTHPLGGRHLVQTSMALVLTCIVPHMSRVLHNERKSVDAGRVVSGLFFFLHFVLSCVVHAGFPAGFHLFLGGGGVEGLWGE